MRLDTGNTKVHVPTILQTRNIGLVNRQCREEKPNRIPVMEPVNHFWHLIYEETPVGMDGIASEHTHFLGWDPFLDIRENFPRNILPCVWRLQACLSETGLE